MWADLLSGRGCRRDWCWTAWQAGSCSAALERWACCYPDFALSQFACSCLCCPSSSGPPSLAWWTAPVRAKMKLIPPGETLCDTQDPAEPLQRRSETKHQQYCDISVMQPGFVEKLLICKDCLFSPRLPFQLVSLRSSVMGELLIPRLWERSPELLQLVLEMDIRDLEGLMADGVSNLTGSFLERWWSTLIIASFSIICAWRFFILHWREQEKDDTSP